ncbi:protein VASCULATURE COMPLEXITY AND CONNECTIVITY-like [Magnolia sinica]|uniref:protein VASCULATURE COMPLEXITY AND CONNECTIVITY-like n=1 Tax=Magnolia sinica TaxID=86752 RepID=UPI00265819EB|nr:protein VASCULATURE COMPLEXITY AND CONNECTIVITY-like [Magnolia sinica]
MAKIGGAFICLVIIIMDIVAGILGIEAELAQNKVKHLRFLVFECKEPSEQAFTLGLAAAGLLALAHVIANLLGGCICIWSQEDFKNSSANKQLAVACLVFSWIILAIGFGVLVIGAMSNSKSRRASCGMSHHNFLFIGGILCFVHGIFCVAYYVSATAAYGEQHKSHGMDQGRV